MTDRHHRWNQYFMQLAVTAASKSKDPSSQVGAVIVDPQRRVVSIGFNGPPRGTDDSALADRERKLLRVLHAEANAILFAQRSLQGHSIYVTHHPCASCAAMIVQAGIDAVYHPPIDAGFVNRWYHSMMEARKLFSEAGVDRVVVAP